MLKYILIGTLAGLACANPAAAQKAPELQTQQSLVEQLSQPTVLDVRDPLAVFAFVINSLPDRVKVYPTENYFYFTFTAQLRPVRRQCSSRRQ